jgi:hypothetical protein
MASANASPRALRAAALESPLAHFEGHQLEMDCDSPACRRARRYAMSELAGFYGRDLLLASVLRRLRCQECGGKAVSVVLLRKVGVRKPAMVRIALFGPEARD